IATNEAKAMALAESFFPPPPSSSSIPHIAYPTIGKLLSTLVATNLSHIAEKHNMLPPGQFGGQPDCNTTDTMHLVVSRIKDAWCSGKVASALFSNMQGAFPNTIRDCLIHNMRECGIPTCYVHLAEWMLSNHQTHLKFDDFLSD
ncbi:hypothetical protein J132_09186, partial [Termitomyces sp. J132]